jgi:hypothetical protein
MLGGARRPSLRRRVAIPSRCDAPRSEAIPSKRAFFEARDRPFWCSKTQVQSLSTEPNFKSTRALGHSTLPVLRGQRLHMPQRPSRHDTRAPATRRRRLGRCAPRSVTIKKIFAQLLEASRASARAATTLTRPRSNQCSSSGSASNARLTRESATRYTDSRPRPPPR